MKKIFTFLAVVGIVTCGFAQWQNGGDRGPKYDNRNNSYGNNNSSALVVTNAAKNNFTVIVDNNYQYQGDANNPVMVNTLSAGNHTVTVYEMSRNFFGKEKKRLAYNSAVYFKPNVETTLSMNSFGQVNITERQLSQNGNGGYGNGNNGGYDNRNYGNNGNGRGNGNGRMKNKHKGNQCNNDNDNNNNDRRGNGRNKNNRDERDDD